MTYTIERAYKKIMKEWKPSAPNAPILDRRYLLTEWETSLLCVISSLWKMVHTITLASGLTPLQTL